MRVISIESSRGEARRQGRREDEGEGGRGKGKGQRTVEYHERKERRKESHAKKKTRPWREMGLTMGRRSAFPVVGSVGGSRRQKREFIRCRGRGWSRRSGWTEAEKEGQEGDTERERSRSG